MGNAVLLTDLGSRNTTLVNGKPANRCTLQAGDEIAVGNVRLLVAEVSSRDETRRAPATPGSTVSIRQSSGFYVRGQIADFLASGKSHTIHDLADLYSLARALWTAGKRDELIVRTREWIADRFEPSTIWIANDIAGTVNTREIYRAPNAEHSQPPQSHCERAIRTGDGLLIRLDNVAPGADTPETLMVVPLVVGPETAGAVAVQSDRRRSSYDEADLELLIAVGCIAAPWVHAMATIETLREETNRLRQSRPESAVLIGSSQLMESVRSAIRLAAQTDLNVLIVGETGSGKEIAARMVHDYSSRHKAPFVPVNCAAIPKDLFESELFGYERGAFTGAVQAKKGLMDECHGGTLFLDEVGDLSPENQARLLRVIESHRFRRLGGNREQEVDFRIVSATNRPLARAITENAFRLDLYYRLNGIEIGMPALRDRKSDIPELAQHFLALVRLRAKRPLKGFGPGALEALQDRELEGNVRELRSIIERAAAVSSGEYIEAEDLAGTPLQYGHQSFPTLADLERQHLLEALQRTQGNMAEAARLLGIGRTTLYEKLARYDLRAR
ncbi:MAG: hypothetical protein AMXMBFR82_07440 [Candidatus Hydrogenedentota bacterium]